MIWLNIRKTGVIYSSDAGDISNILSWHIKFPPLLGRSSAERTRSREHEVEEERGHKCSQLTDLQVDSTGGFYRFCSSWEMLNTIVSGRITLDKASAGCHFKISNHIPHKYVYAHPGLKKTRNPNTHIRYFQKTLVNVS